MCDDKAGKRMHLVGFGQKLTKEMEKADYIPHPHGTLVFWTPDGGKKPHWVIDWQPNNGPDGAYWLVDAAGVHACAAKEELSLYPM